VLDAEFAVAAVEISHLAGSQMGGANREARPAVVHQIEIDEFAKRPLERFRGVISGAIGTDRTVRAGMGERIGSEETGNAVCHR
jgi:hypothetical protein